MNVTKGEAWVSSILSSSCPQYSQGDLFIHSRSDFGPKIHVQVVHLRGSHRILLRKWKCDSGKRWWPIKEHCYLSVDSGWLESNNQKAVLANPGLLRVVPPTPLPRELGSSLRSSRESSIVAPCGPVRSSELAASSAGTGGLLEVGRRPCWKPSWSRIL